jgi:hypothetical protein
MASKCMARGSELSDRKAPIRSCAVAADHVVALTPVKA